MIAAIRAEFRKLLTVRSTYVITGLTLVGVALLAYFVLGRDQEAFSADSPRMLYDSIYTSIGVFATFSTIVAILLVTHEYRYNTIMHTLTLSNSRLRIVIAKAAVLIAYTLVVGLAVAGVGYFMTKVGLASAGAQLAPQELPLWSTFWQLGAYTIGYTLSGVVLGLLIRGVVGAIVVYFMTPVAEQLLGLVLKENTKYLPFQALEKVAGTATEQMSPVAGGDLSHAAALGVFSIYLAVGLVVATVLFIRRDAS